VRHKTAQSSIAGRAEVQKSSETFGGLVHLNIRRVMMIATVSRKMATPKVIIDENAMRSQTDFEPAMEASLVSAE